MPLGSHPWQERPYHDDSTASRLLSEVKHHWAQLVLRWGTTLESSGVVLLQKSALLWIHLMLLLQCILLLFAHPVSSFFLTRFFLLTVMSNDRTATILFFYFKMQIELRRGYYINKLGLSSGS